MTGYIRNCCGKKFWDNTTYAVLYYVIPTADRNSNICQNWGFLNFEVFNLVKSLLAWPLKSVHEIKQIKMNCSVIYIKLFDQKQAHGW